MKLNKGQIKKLQNECKGITLTSLVITIVVLMILTGVTLSLTIGDNGIILRELKAKEQAEIAGEKEIVQTSAFEAQYRNKDMNLVEEEFQIAMDNNTSEGETEVSDVGDEFEVIFWEKNRYYTVNKDGQLSGEGKIIEDKNPGDITTGKDGEKLDGSEDHPYEIWCIEDLVAFSNMVGGEGYIINNGQLEEVKGVNSLNGKYISLKRNLNFKSRLSYDNSERTDLGDINGNNDDGNVLINEMQTGRGFKPIGVNTNGYSYFQGNFNGENNKISNIYIDSPLQNAPVGLFSAGYVTIKNLTISGQIKGKWHTGSMIGDLLGGKIENCNNYANITGYNMVGGICALTTYTNPHDIKYCKNYGNIEINGSSYQYAGIGGILGCCNSGEDNEIVNCENYGDVNKEKSIATGGIIGNISSTITIDNCINKGNLNNEASSGGIVGWVRMGKNIILKNLCNYGNCRSGIANSFSGANWNSILELTIKNCYNLGETKVAGIVGTQGNTCKEITLNIENCYNAGKSDKAIIGSISKNVKTTTITNIKNTYYDKSKSNSVGATEEGITEVKIQDNEEFVNILNENIAGDNTLKQWKLGEDGYPTFVE